MGSTGTGAVQVQYRCSKESHSGWCRAVQVPQGQPLSVVKAVHVMQGQPLVTVRAVHVPQGQPLVTVRAVQVPQGQPHVAASLTHSRGRSPCSWRCEPRPLFLTR